MATYVDQYTLSADAGFKQRVEQAVVKAAMTVLDGGADSGRIALAQRVMADPTSFAAIVAKAVVTDSVVSASAPTGSTLTDAQLQTAVNSVLAKFVR